MDINLMISIFPSLLNGAVITLKLLASSMFFGLLIGLLFAILRINKNPIINKFAYGYSYFFRGTPLLVQIYLIYFSDYKNHYWETWQLKRILIAEENLPFLLSYF